MQYTVHIINPLTGTYNNQKKITTIISSDPLEAEVLRTDWMIADNNQRKQISTHFKNIQGNIYTL